MSNDSAREQVTIERVFDGATVDDVWEMWTTKDGFEAWWGPDGFVCTEKERDVRVGGVWRFDMTGPDGTVWPNRIDYREIVPESKLVMDHGDDGGDISFLVTVTFDEQQDGKTVLTMRQLHPSQEARDGGIAFGAVELGFQTLDKLAKRLAV